MIRQAMYKDMEQIMKIVEAIRIEVMENDMLKWDEHYPTTNMFEEDIRNGDLYVIEDGGAGHVIGFACINGKEHAEFKDIPWENDKGLVVHRLGICPHYRRKGYGLSMIDFAEKLAINMERPDLKCCIYERNFKSEKLFKKKGFHYIGAINFPEYNGEFYCYEKQLAVVSRRTLKV